MRRPSFSSPLIFDFSHPHTPHQILTFQTSPISFVTIYSSLLKSVWTKLDLHLCFHLIVLVSLLLCDGPVRRTTTNAALRVSFVTSCYSSSLFSFPTQFSLTSFYSQLGQPLERMISGDYGGGRWRWHLPSHFLNSVSSPTTLWGWFLEEVFSFKLGFLKNWDFNFLQATLLIIHLLIEDS